MRRLPIRSKWLAAVLAAVVVAGITVSVVLAARTGTTKPEATRSGGAVVDGAGSPSNSKALEHGGLGTAPATPGATPTATPTRAAAPPRSGGGCAPFPKFPDVNCTGPTGTLKTYNGPLTFNTPGQVIKDVVINTSGFRVTADNVTFRNCRIVYTGALDDGFALVYLPAGVTGTTFDHCELDGRDKIERAIQGVDGVIVRNCDIHNTGNGLEVGTNIVMTESYVHDIYTPAGLDWHADGVQAGDSASNITIDHNVILLTTGETGAINIVSNGGSGKFRDILIEHNLMAGGGYTVYAGSSAANTSNFKVVDNQFSTRYFPKAGRWNIWYPTYLSGVTISGNTINETGKPANDNL
jgi:hypothetical protein